MMSSGNRYQVSDIFDQFDELDGDSIDRVSFFIFNSAYLIADGGYRLNVKQIEYIEKGGE
jgi:hypothetical protein